MNAKKKNCLLSVLIVSFLLGLCTWYNESLGNDVKPGNNGGGMQPVDPNIANNPVADIINDWIEVRDVMDGEKDVIEEQLSVAYETMPDLARHYQANVLYIGFLQNLLLEWPLEFPTSDLPPPPPSYFPSWLCEGILGERFMCKCLTATNDLKHCLLLDAKRSGADLGEDEIIPESNSGKLLQSYKEALSCQLRILEKDNPTDEDWKELVQCKKDADRYWSAYVLRGYLSVQIVP